MTSARHRLAGTRVAGEQRGDAAARARRPGRIRHSSSTRSRCRARVGELLRSWAVSPRAAPGRPSRRVGLDAPGEPLQAGGVLGAGAGREVGSGRPVRRRGPRPAGARGRRRCATCSGAEQEVGGRRAGRPPAADVAVEHVAPERRALRDGGRPGRRRPAGRPRDQRRSHCTRPTRITSAPGARRALRTTSRSLGEQRRPAGDEHGARSRASRTAALHQVAPASARPGAAGAGPRTSASRPAAERRRRPASSPAALPVRSRR